MIQVEVPIGFSPVAEVELEYEAGVTLAQSIKYGHIKYGMIFVPTSHFTIVI